MSPEADVQKQLQELIIEGFSPRFNQLKDSFDSAAKWKKMRQLGTQLWLDSGDIEDAQRQWKREFSGLTVNNTLLNNVVQSGCYDDFIAAAAEIIDRTGQCSGQEKLLEINFALNAKHGLKLVEKFDAYVSLEEHTDLADNLDMAVSYAKRFYAVCPERFCVKIPFTAAGVLAAKKAAAEGVPVNHTLGFSARQNYFMARFAKPAYVNVFLGRLNSFVEQNQLGSGKYVGQKATLASQRAVSRLRKQNLTESRQIAASIRDGKQIQDLAGVDVMTIPPKAAGLFDDTDIGIDTIVDKRRWDYQMQLKKDVDIRAVRLDTLWDIENEMVECVEKLEKEYTPGFTADDLYDFFARNNCGDVLVKWDDSQVKTSREEGKVPNLQNWAQPLAEKKIGLDSLMNLAGLGSFTADQEQIDNRIKNILK